MKYVKCNYCTVGIVETTTVIIAMGMTKDVPVNRLNGSAICDICVDIRKKEAGKSFSPLDYGEKRKSNDLY